MLDQWVHRLQLGHDTAGQEEMQGPLARVLLDFGDDDRAGARPVLERSGLDCGLDVLKGVGTLSVAKGCLNFALMGC